MSQQLQTPTDLPDVSRPLAEAASRIGAYRGDQPPHPTALVRWITRGVALRKGGRLRLVARKFPGGWRVSDQAINEFVDALTADRCGDPACPAAPDPQTELAGQAVATSGGSTS